MSIFTHIWMNEWTVHDFHTQHVFLSGESPLQNTNIGFTKTVYHLYHTIIGTYHPVLQFSYHKTQSIHKRHNTRSLETLGIQLQSLLEIILQFMNSILHSLCSSHKLAQYTYVRRESLNVLLKHVQFLTHVHLRASAEFRHMYCYCITHIEINLNKNTLKYKNTFKKNTHIMKGHTTPTSSIQDDVVYDQWQVEVYCSDLL